MALREYTDAAGVPWQVWHVVPTTRPSAPVLPSDRRKQADGEFPEERRRRGVTLTPGMEGGWLCFECAAEKRRLMPVPADWESCADEAIGQYLTRAAPVTRRIVETASPQRLEPTM